MEQFLTPDILAKLQQFQQHLTDAKTNNPSPSDTDAKAQLFTTNNMANMLTAAQSMLKTDPDFIENIAKSIPVLNGMSPENMNGEMVESLMQDPSALLGMVNAAGEEGGALASLASSFLGVGAAQNAPTATLPPSTNYFEKDVLLPASEEEIAAEKSKMFRIKGLDPRDPEKKIKYNLQLEKGVYAYQFWHQNKGDDVQDCLVRVAIELYGE